MVDELDSGELRDWLARPDDADLDHALLRDRAKARLFGPTPLPQIARFEVERLLGRGGMGEVYLARDPELRRPVAIKLVHAALLADSNSRGRERALREAQALAQVSHPNVIEVFEVGEHEGRPFVAMEYIEGETLERWIRDQQPGWSEIVEVFIEAGRGLAAVHRAGLIHRDFKPDNVLISASEDGRRVRVLDFGLARLTEAEVEVMELGATAPDFDITSVGAILGTPAFMPLEQLRGLTVSAASDQFSFCVALYRALWRVEPFAGQGIEARIAALEQDDPREPPDEGRGLRRVWPVVARGLARAPAERWPDMPALLAALEQAAKRRRRWPWLAGAAAVALVSGAALVSASRAEAPPALDPEDPCAPLVAKAEALWPPSLVAAAAREYAALPQTYAVHTFERADLVMRRWSEAWRGRRSEVCLASEGADPIERQRIARRARCLDAAYVEAEATSQALRRVDADSVDTYAVVLDALPALEPCLHDAYLEQGAEPPSSAQHQQVEGARVRLAALRVMRRAGRPVSAEAGLNALREELDGVDYPPLAAELASEAAKLALTRSDRVETLEQLAAATSLAEGARLEQLAARNWTVLAFEAAVEHRDAALARRWLERAEVAAARLARPAELDARLTCIEGALAGLEGEGERARSVLAASLAKLDGLAEAGAPVHLWMPSCLEARARAAAPGEDARPWLIRALKAAREVYGPEHPALESFRVTLAAHDLRHGQDSAGLELGELGQLLDALDSRHLDVAQLLVDDFEARLVDKKGPDSPARAQVDLMRGQIAFELGDYAASLAHYDLARGRLADDPEMAPFVAQIDFNRGACLFGLRDVDGARAVFEAYVETPGAGMVGDAYAQLAQLAFATGRRDALEVLLEQGRRHVDDTPDGRFDLRLTELLMQLRPLPGESAGTCAALREELAAILRGVDERDQADRLELTLGLVEATPRERRCLGLTTNP